MITKIKYQITALIRNSLGKNVNVVTNVFWYEISFRVTMTFYTRVLFLICNNYSVN